MHARWYTLQILVPQEYCFYWTFLSTMQWPLPQSGKLLMEHQQNWLKILCTEHETVQFFASYMYVFARNGCSLMIYTGVAEPRLGVAVPSLQKLLSHTYCQSQACEFGMLSSGAISSSSVDCRTVQSSMCLCENDFAHKLSVFTNLTFLHELT